MGPSYSFVGSIFGLLGFLAIVEMDITDPQSYLFDPAVIVADWVAFIILFGSAVIIGRRLMQFEGPSEQPEDYFFG